MHAYQTAAELVSSNNLTGPCDLYQVLLTIKNGFGNGSKIGSYSITKAQAKKAKIEWSFIEKSCNILGLKIENRHGRHGHMISL